MVDELVTVKTFWNAIEAHLAKSALEMAGIQAFLENENVVLMDWGPGNPVVGVKLNVKNSDVQRAIEALKPQV
jgi:hypothetical protein